MSLLTAAAALLGAGITLWGSYYLLVGLMDSSVARLRTDGSCASCGRAPLNISSLSRSATCSYSGLLSL